MKTPPQLICLIGAESTGKTTLAQVLAERFDSPWVPEYLRAFCDERGRTPRHDEQSMIIEVQTAQETRALRQATDQGAPFVFCDTAALLTAIYSEYVFADDSLITRGSKLHERYALTLLLEADIDWVPDELQREGAHVRGPITAMIQRHLNTIAAPYERVRGTGDARVASAIEGMQRHSHVSGSAVALRFS